MGFEGVRIMFLIRAQNIYWAIYSHIPNNQPQFELGFVPFELSL